MKLAITAALALALLPASGAAEPDGDDGRVVRVIHNPPGDAPILGPRHAPVTIEFFFQLDDYNAQRLYPLLVQLARRHPLRLRLVYRPVVIRVDRYGANTMAMEAFRQGRFHEFLDKYYESRNRRRSHLAEIAKDVGIDYQRYTESLRKLTHQSALAANAARASRFKLTNPKASLLINGQPIPGVRKDLETLETYYDTAYQQARELLDLGYPLGELYDRILRRRAAEEKVPRVPIGAIDGRVPRRPKKNGIPLAGTLDYDGPHSRGATAAPVVIVSFCRFASRHCGNQFNEITTAMAAFEGEVRHVFKPLYDPEKDPHERRAHLAAECAADQGAFWEFVALVYGYQSQLRSGDDSVLKRAFGGLDLDDRQFEACLADERHAARVDAQLAEAARVGVRYSPSTIIGGRIYIGRPQLSHLIRLLELELAPGLLGGWLDGPGDITDGR